MAIERVPFSLVEAHHMIRPRRLSQVELLGIDEGFKRFDTPVGLFQVVNGQSKLVAVVEFDDLFDLSGNRFYND